MEMATQVLIAHTGQRLQVDTSQFVSYVPAELFDYARSAGSQKLTNDLG
jgi:hypothetical protein